MKTVVLNMAVLGSLCLGATSVSYGAGGKEIAIYSNRSVRQQVDTLAELLEKEVSKAKNNRDRFRATNRVVGQIKSLRDNSVPQGAQDEAHMDLMVSILESLPSEKSFKKKDCPKYESDLLNQYEPTAEDVPQEPVVQPAWKILNSLCQ